MSWHNPRFTHSCMSWIRRHTINCPYIDMRKKFRIPLMVVLMLEDHPTLMKYRAKEAMSFLFSDMYMKIKKRYYLLTLEYFQLMLKLASSVKSFSARAQKREALLKVEFNDFLNKDPVACLNEMQWLETIPRTSETLNLNNKLLIPSIEDMMKLNLLDKMNKLDKILNKDEQQEFATIDEVMKSRTYKAGDRLQFFSEKYKDWLDCRVVKTISDEVVLIEYELSSKERNTPIFVFREVLESLDKDYFGDTIQEAETFAYFHRLLKLIDS